MVLFYVFLPVAENEVVRWHLGAIACNLNKRGSRLNKPIYEPGETVNFRVIVLDSDLKPPKYVTNVTVSINGPIDSTVREWDAALLTIGVFEASFQISSSPVLGKYEIVVDSDGDRLVSKMFEVKEYVLSGVDVDVHPSRIPLEDHQAVDLTVVAKNVFGKPVRGTINLTLFEEMSNMKVNSICEVNGTAQLTMLFNRPFYIFEDFKEIALNFTFVEQYTNRKQIKSIPITVFKHMYRAKMIKKSLEFHPGQPFKATIKIEFHDGSPATNVKCIVQVEGTEENEFERVSDNNGEILLQLTPSESEDVITLTVLVDGQEILEEEISKAKFKTKSFLEISLKSSAQVNMPIRLNINCDKSVKFFMYYVMAKGNIIDQGYVSVTRRTSANIYVQYSASMVPKATVFVVTVAGDRMVYDTMDILFEEQVNNIHVDIQQKQVQPGGHVNLNVRGRQGSYVALAAYDKRLREYGSIHDLTWKDVEMLYEHFYSIEEDEFDIFAVTACP
ncbi:hypothetical protein ZHAS_00004707 [Anopheles sinensis]|uniref:TEP1-F n=1 Tax=Anopheles sinensis TaxID=74873 RepID=A0A084VHP2_ANOSI|nr:hypothetical protein ZHAS_00004707 [Anopheles sinensis]